MLEDIPEVEVTLQVELARKLLKGDLPIVERAEIVFKTWPDGRRPSLMVYPFAKTKESLWYAEHANKEDDGSYTWNGLGGLSHVALDSIDYIVLTEKK